MRRICAGAALLALSIALLLYGDRFPYQTEGFAVALLHDLPALSLLAAIYLIAKHSISLLIHPHRCS